MNIVSFFLRLIFKTVWVGLKTFLSYYSKHPIHALLNTTLLVALVVVIMTSSTLHEQLFLDRMTGETVRRVAEASRFTREYNSEKVKNRGLKEFLQVGAPRWSQEASVRAVLYHARQKKLSIEHQAVLLTIVEIESGFNPVARAPTTSACGLFQFVRGTGKLYELSDEDCMNPWLNAQAGVRHYVDNYKKRVEPDTSTLEKAEKVFRLFELGYYLHHDGPNSSNPSNDLKATILGGTQFLLQVYSILEDEMRSREKVTSFVDEFKKSLHNLWFRVSYAFDVYRGMIFPKAQP